MTHRREIIAEGSGHVVTGIRKRWWERTYSVPRVVVWLVVASAVIRIPHETVVLVRWLS